MSDDPAVQKLRQAVAFFGNATLTAKAIGITPQAVSEVLRRGGRAPAGWCIKLERAIAKKVSQEGRGELITRHQLRPDLYPDDPSPATGEK